MSNSCWIISNSFWSFFDVDAFCQFLDVILYSINKYLLSSYCVPDTFLGSGATLDESSGEIYKYISTGNIKDNMWLDR